MSARILVVDDIATNIHLLEARLRAEYYEVASASSGPAAIRLAEEWLPESFYDLIIVDPPSMASNKTQVAKALKTYHRIYSNLRSKLKADGTLIACCCTSRISPREFEDKVSYALRPMSRKFALPMERDHQPAFAEADYLKVLVFRQDPGAKPQKVPVYRREPRPAAAKKSDGPAGKGRGPDRERAKGRPSPSKAKAKAKKPRRR